MSGAQLPPPTENPDLFGHAAAEAAFLASWRSGRLAHGWMIEGAQGLGKATFAFRLARSLLRPAGDSGDVQNPSHPIFRMVAHGAHPDLCVLTTPVDPKTGRRKGEIPVAAARAVGDALHNTAARGGARVLIVDAADDLNRNAANALLKLLEEPPPGVVILLVVQRQGLVPETIASRCARLRLRPLDDVTLFEALRRLDPALSHDMAMRLVAIAEGSPGRAFQLARTGWLDSYSALLRSLAAEGAGLGEALAAADLLVRVRSNEGAPTATSLLSEVLRRLSRVAAGAPGPTPLFEDEEEHLERLVERLGLDRILALWEKLGALAGRLETLNLDPLQTFLPIVEAVTGGRASRR